MVGISPRIKNAKIIVIAGSIVRKEVALVIGILFIPSSQPIF